MEKCRNNVMYNKDKKLERKRHTFSMRAGRHLADRRIAGGNDLDTPLRDAFSVKV